ncbi:MAG TPA: hypothetical protein VLK28_01650 [Methylomirabilota bacterium]|nr:hypothetical protein [Methylomirabilota bacterium]
MLLKLVLLGAGSAVLVLLALVVIPDENDYAMVSVDKHARLAADVPRKLVFVGGSNLSYGLDSVAVERELGVFVVNMGLNAHLGLRFMLDEVKPALRPGDSVVLSLEYEVFFQPVDGYGMDQLALVKVRPSSLRYLRTWGQWRGVVKALQLAVQEKLERTIRAAIGQPRRMKPYVELKTQVETRAGTNEYGDLTSHLAMKWPYPLWRDRGLKVPTFNSDCVAVLRRFEEEMRNRGVRVLYVHPPVNRSYYEDEKEAIELAHTRLREGVPFEIAAPARYVFPDAMFFDMVYHLNAEGRAVRTARVIADLRPHLTALTTIPPRPTAR